MRFTVAISACEVEPWLDQALRSVETQSFGDLEILAVCEEGNDATPSILERHAAGDNRIGIIRLPRSGSASAGRNYAIEHARGEYLVFLDGDDWLEPGALAALDGIASANGSPDLIACEYRFWRDGKPAGGERPHANPGRILSGTEALTEFLADASYRSATWRNVFRREFLVNSGCRQIVGRRHQDDEWTPRVFCAAKSVLVSGILLYNYRKRENSVTTDGSDRSLTDIAGNLAAMVEYLSHKSLPGALMRLMTSWQCRTAARFYSPLWRRKYPLEKRRTALREALGPHENELLRLLPYAGVRDSIFLLGRRILSWRLVELLYRGVYWK